jgi:hypothetical protein
MKIFMRIYFNKLLFMLLMRLQHCRSAPSDFLVFFLGGSGDEFLPLGQPKK